MAKTAAIKAVVFKALIQVRLDDAMALLTTGKQARRNGAIYLAGYAVECALKTRVCLDRGEQFLDSRFYTHDLSSLLDKTRKGVELKRQDLRAKSFRSIVSTWSVSMRYNAAVLEDRDVRIFLSECRGFVKWLLSES